MVLETLEKTTSTAAPTASVIWLHGLGADGHDFYPIVDPLQLSEIPIRFVFPHAPVRPVSINGNMPMRAWYDIRQIDLVREEDAGGIHTSAEQIEQLIAQEQEKGIPANRIILAGFSQGSAMTLHTGLRYPEKLGGLVALSGYLPLANTLLAEKKEANQHTPIFMAHGTYDPVVPIKRAEESLALLQQAGYSVNWQTYPMEHSVHPEEISAIRQFILDILTP